MNKAGALISYYWPMIVEITESEKQALANMSKGKSDMNFAEDNSQNDK